MAGQDNTSCYSCEGTLLVPTVDDRVSHWRERLVSGNRMTITLKVAGQRWSSDARFLLWGENYQQEKVFEVNLRFVRGYFVRTRTWHEITSSDRRRFALNFHESNQFSRFLEELESTLTFLNKLTTTDTMTSSDGVTGGIVVLRVDKLPPAKPPRAAGERRPLSVGAPQTPPLDDQRVFGSTPELKSRVVRGGNTETRDDVTDDVPDDEQTTKWYVNIYDQEIAGPPPVPVPRRLDDISNVYETIADLDSSPANLNESNTHEGIDTYYNISGELHAHTCAATKPNGAIASNNSFLDVGNGKPTVVIQNRYPTARKPVATHVYDDRDRYDNVALGIATNIQPVPTKSKPRVPPRCNDLSTGNKPTSAVTNEQPNITSATDATPRPQPLPRPRKPKDDRSPLGDNWACNQCTLLNPATASRCAACDLARHGSRGVQHVTVPRDDSNDVPLQRLPSSYVVPSACFSILTANNETWTCSVCSANNQREARDCHSCSAWVCGHCTLHNHPDLWICSVCSRSRLHTSLAEH